MKIFPATIKAADNRHPSAVWKNAHLWYIAIILIACSLFYYLDSILHALGWATPQWSILSMPHDFHRFLFVAPVLYASYIFRIRGAVITALISMAIFLPRALFISPYAEPLFRPLFFCIALGMVAVFGAKLLDEITARKKTEEVLERCKFMVESAQDAIFFKNLSSHYIIANAKTAEAFGLPLEEIIGKSDYQIMQQQEEARKNVADDQIVFKTGKPTHITKHMTARDGKGYWFEATKAPQFDEKGNVIGLIGIARDITERKRREAEIRREKERSEAYLNIAGVMLAIIDAAENISLINNKGCETLGYKAEELMGRNWLDTLVPQRIRAEIRGVFAKLMAGDIEPVEYYENPLLTKDGEEKIIAFHNTVLRNPDGQISGALFSGEDITQHKKAEEKLVDEATRRRILVEQSRDGIVILEQNGKVYEANQQFAKMLGYSPEETDQLHLWDWDTQWTKEQLFEMLRTVDEAGAHFETYHRRKDGTIYDVEISTNGAVCAGQKLVFCVCRDITERKKAEEKLRESNERYKFLLDRALEAIWFTAYEEPIDITLPEMEIARLISETGIIVEANDVLAKIYSFDRGSQLIGKRWSELDSTEYNLQFAMEMVRNHYKVDRFIQAGKDLEGNTAYFEESEVGNIVDGKLVSSLGMTRNITGRKKMEEEKKELEQKAQFASRLATVGEMSSGIAHEINNPLTGVIGFSQLLMQKKDIPEDIREYTKIIHDGAQRVAGIVDRLLTFARQHKPERSHASINNIIEATLKLRAYEMESSNIKLTTQLDPDLPETVADAAQLQQVFLNIIINAEAEMKSAHGKGKLLVKTEDTDNTIRISFTDDGPGIASENLERVFDPFFTTREVGEGTGLGLSICHGIIAEHHGQIYARSKLGQGATFVVELPVVAEGKQVEPHKPATKELKTVTEARILVVDDEPSNLQLLTQLLSREGHRVETVESADAALERIKSERYNLILLDIKLPGMSGMELYKEIKRTARTLARRVVFITGDVLAADTRDFLSRAKVPYVSKPFNIEELKNTINRTLARG